MTALRQIGRTAKRIYAHYDTIPEAIGLVNYKVYMLLNLAQTLAWITHASWMFLFIALKIYPLAYTQIVSVLSYVLAINLNRRGHHMTSMTISMAEIVLHQIYVSRALGWDAGFQYFIPVASIFPFLVPKAKIIWKWALVGSAAAGYLYIDLFIRKANPIYDVNKIVLYGFNIVNILLAFGFFATWAYYFTVSVNRSQIIIDKQTRELAKAEHAIEQAKVEERLRMEEREKIAVMKEKERYQELLLNILPEEVAMELKEKGKSEARLYQNVSVMFTDFKDFTKISEKLSPEELVYEIDECFKAFDAITVKYEVEKIKTIGDSYMAVCGLPAENSEHAVRVVQAALEMQAFMKNYNERQRLAGKQVFETRIGINSGAVVAGIVGVKKFAYDIWGDTVNIASRMESCCEEGKVNISGACYELVKDKFRCSYRGKLQAKNKGEVDMYFVEAPTFPFATV
jgi:class 3 adenylate cyclase